MQDKQDPLANALLQPQSTGTLVVELDWLPMRTSKDEPLVLCIAGADSSFRLIEVNMYGKLNDESMCNNLILFLILMHQWLNYNPDNYKLNVSHSH